MAQRSFFAELKRRNVYKVAIAYIVAAWALAQGFAQVLPVFDVPNWAVRILIVLLVVGFRVALALAWLFEITPEGIKRTEDVDPAESIRRRTGRKIVALTLALAAVALAVTIVRLPHPTGVDQALPSRVVDNSTNVSSKSIAVLPFVNISGDKGDEYLSDGMTEELLNVLSKVKGLRVPGRSSSFAFKGINEE